VKKTHGRGFAYRKRRGRPPWRKPLTEPPRRGENFLRLGQLLVADDTPKYGKRANANAALIPTAAFGFLEEEHRTSRLCASASCLGSMKASKWISLHTAGMAMLPYCAMHSLISKRHWYPCDTLGSHFQVMLGMNAVPIEFDWLILLKYFIIKVINYKYCKKGHQALYCFSIQFL